MNTAPVIQNPGLTEREWEQVHAQVHSAFNGLAQRVRSRCPSVIVRAAGKTSGRVWFLYSYREFNLTESDTEAEDIVAGMHFSSVGDSIRIQADLGGAETGQTDFEAPARVVPANLNAVLAAARELGEELSLQDEILVKALTERRPPPNDRNSMA